MGKNLATILAPEGVTVNIVRAISHVDEDWTDNQIGFTRYDSSYGNDSDAKEPDMAAWCRYGQAVGN